MAPADGETYLNMPIVDLTLPKLLEKHLSWIKTMVIVTKCELLRLSKNIKVKFKVIQNTSNSNALLIKINTRRSLLITTL